MTKLLKLLSDIAYNWRNIGDFLEVPQSELEELHRLQPMDDVKPKLRKVLQIWLARKTSVPTWKEIIDMLEEDMENGMIANKIRSSLGISKKSQSRQIYAQNLDFVLK